MPDDPELLTRELLQTAFSRLKQFQLDNQIYCRHPISEEVRFLLTQCGKGYKAKHVLPGGKVEYKPLLDKWLESRVCCEDTFNRDELQAILSHLGLYFPGKKADYMFFNSNEDGDANLDANEFTKMWLYEQAQKDKKRRILTDYYLKI